MFSHFVPKEVYERTRSSTTLSLALVSADCLQAADSDDDIVHFAWQRGQVLGSRYQLVARLIGRGTAFAVHLGSRPGGGFRMFAGFCAAECLPDQFLLRFASSDVIAQLGRLYVVGHLMQECWCCVPSCWPTWGDPTMILLPIVALHRKSSWAMVPSEESCWQRTCRMIGM